MRLSGVNVVKVVVNTMKQTDKFLHLEGKMFLSVQQKLDDCLRTTFFLDLLMGKKN